MEKIDIRSLAVVSQTNNTKYYFALQYKLTVLYTAFRKQVSTIIIRILRAYD